MEVLSIKEIINRIKNYDSFEAVPLDHSFHIKIREYVPFICAAIHAGGNFRDNLKDKIIHSSYERWYEEDPFTDTFITSMPLTIVGKDSRFEYDLNRNPDNCVYEDAWGKQVWKKPLSKTLKKESLTKHANFYKVIDALIESIEELHKGCIVFDMHSYNYVRHNKELPVFNIGSENIDNDRYGKVINKWFDELKNIPLGNFESTTEINGPFQGNGYFLMHITEKFNNTLVLATEVKKIYCNELDQTDYPIVIDQLEHGFKKSIVDTSCFFVDSILNLKMNKGSLLSPGIDAQLLEVDKRLYKLTKTLEVLSYVTPQNLEVEKRKFLKQKGKINPRFRYKQIVEHPFEFKRKLYALPLEYVKDVTIAKLYRDVIKSYSDKIDMLSSIGTKRFFYNSLRYFGQPNETDLKHANFILNCPNSSSKSKKIPIEQVKTIFEDEIKNYGFKADVEITNHLTAEIMVLNYKKKVLLKKGTFLSEHSVKALVHHEIGVHMVTTMNAIDQPLNIFKLGFPTNTYTQEGIAVLTEYLSGHLTIHRLKELALRVVAIDMMINGLDFKQVYHELINSYYLNHESAFILCTRIFRGGGFTKDHLYLKGFIHILKYYKEGNSLDYLLTGKNSIEYLEVYKEMTSRDLAKKPKYITSILSNPKKSSPEVEYIISGLIN
tara:strand:- start:17 stop:2005 length:1989 start_codon:yes stop_codon:yes gene_type:complete